MLSTARHGLGQISALAWRCDLRCAVVEVHDSGRGLPALPSPVRLAGLDPLVESGRGLPLVTAYARGRCGVAPLTGERGKAVWFALPLGELWPFAASVATFVTPRIWIRRAAAHYGSAPAGARVTSH
ncbi:ATP-binding protein [Marinactinospora rubrisoli]|uniref:ATP-binding protein n=1 Tax=Marinactinospora rubrisoli TaxID=2715399 RepID=A0ABW2K8D8_9ACTN